MDNSHKTKSEELKPNDWVEQSKDDEVSFRLYYIELLGR